MARLLHRVLTPVLPVRLCAVPGRLYTVLMGYKESPVDAARRRFARLVGEHFATLFGDHAACVRALLGGGIDVVLPVPSSSRPGRSSLEGVRDLGDLVVSAFGPGAHWMPGLLRRSGAPVGHMRPHARAFAPTDQAAVRHARVLLLDDTYVSGARAQSASAALGSSGARAIVIVPVGRVLRPDRVAAHAAYLAAVRQRVWRRGRCCRCCR
ncbi:MAG: hypothetical protein ACLPVF_08700 [Acidimicrobiales bacterium]